MLSYFLYLNILCFLQVVRSEDCCSTSTLCEPTAFHPTKEPPFFGTVDVFPGLITNKDKSDFKKSKKSGKGSVEMWQGESLQETAVTKFKAQFKDGLSVTVAVHEKIKANKAKKYAKAFAKVLGRIPTMFRKSVKNLHLFPGKLGTESCGAWGFYKTGTISLCVEDGLEKIK